MENKNQYVRLRNGVQVPILGLGTTHNGGYVHETVVYAIKECGYRHLDTAKRYGVEQFLGRAIQESGIPRSEMFLSTKLWPTDYGKEKCRAAALSSMQRLDTDYLDLYMLHYPNCPSWVEQPQKWLAETWRELELLMDEDRIRAIGVSNFQKGELEMLSCSMETSGIAPHVNQCEYHPLQNPQTLIQYCQDNEIQFEGFCPLAKGQLLTHDPVVKIAQSVGKTPAQVLVRWSIQNKVLTIPKSTKKERVLENFEALDFELPDSSMEILDNLHQDFRVIALENVEAKLDTDLPDGYKMSKFPCSFPSLLT